ncbi:uncharacterized protein Eint_090350 [Encephalitozoon intestinalis ATCC 50506]|uniref:Uncharacterized protein n=1 Tax=Encephalitozoon intestinalis (strain ATCC 50506) TaxID=876142 RepID=E0S9A1_ENCIT|nr:uncharacterized protein Eint_090350 [Encephalitozoon intestinalis ATCC 50506]ADM12165.1 hypothetical protein Eint_090350 [Encephalitozoon intestinalis ATCC 50506]UTX45967.1 hypothetical protein GPK93_09g15520 [Encephalitozoon intestinalis]
MEENTAENSIPNTEARPGDIRIGEVSGEDTLVLYLSQGTGNTGEQCNQNGRCESDISKCKKHKASNCICLSKIHYEIDGDVLCIREMKPFIYISKISILCQCSPSKQKIDNEARIEP